MNILQTMLAADGGEIVQQLADQFGINPTQATATMSALLPALAGGMKEKMESGAGPEIAQWLRTSRLSQFADYPDSLASPGALNQGRTLLSTIFGSEDTSHLVSLVAEKVGLGSGVISSMLPISATLLGAFLSKDAAAGGNPADTLMQIANLGQSGLLDAVKGVASRILR
jgi:hypothetical protein